MIRPKRTDHRFWSFSLLIMLVVMTAAAYGQGSIYGSVQNSDASVPANGDISFFGYLDSTDEEIRIETSIGAGYDAGNWFDDFQNYLTEAPGNPYAYHFFNIANDEGFKLTGPIPVSSYQQEDVVLDPVSWPAAPQGLAGQALSSSSILVTWNADPSLTYHIYRRDATSDGSLFRRDDTTGSLANPGVADSFYIDNTPGDTVYTYLLIAEDALGNLSPHSVVLAVDTTPVAPVITSITPDSGFATGGTLVTLLGNGFDSAGVAVTIDGNDLTSITVVSPYEITGITPPGVSGAADVVVTNTASTLSSDPLVGGFVYISNDPPVVAGIPDQTVPEGTPFDTLILDDYVTDPDSPDSEIVWTYSGAAFLTVTIDADRVATITPPNPDWNGTDTIIFRATDPGGLFDEDTAVFIMTPVNSAPVVTGIPDQTINEGGTFTQILLDNYVTDPDNLASEMDWSYSGNVALNVNINPTHKASITVPSPDWSGADTIIFRATDPGGAFGEDTVVFTVLAVNDPPIVTGIPDQTISEGGSFNPIPLDNFVTDADNADSQMVWTYSGNDNLNISIAPNRTATVTPINPNWNGSDTVIFRATDPGGAFDEDTAIFTVTPVNDRPSVAQFPGQTVPEGGAFAPIALDDFVMDVDNADSEMIWTYTSTSLNVTISADRIATVTTPNPDWYGVDTIVFRATDPGGLYGEGRGIFTVTPVNDAPVVAGIPDQAIIGNDDFAPIVLDNYAGDVDGLVSDLVWSFGGQTDLDVIIINRVAFVSIPDSSWVGSESVTFRATDTGSAYDQDTAQFVHVAVAMPENNFADILVGHSDSLPFSIITPPGFVVDTPQFIPSGPSLIVRRADGSPVDADIPANATTAYWVVWTPIDTLTGPGTVSISSVSLDNSASLSLTGQAVTLDINPPFTQYLFGDVNRVDRRAADTLDISADIIGSVNGRISGVVVVGDSTEFTVSEPLVGDTLIAGSTLRVAALAHPRTTGTRSARVWIRYEVDLPGGTVGDSLMMMILTAVGVDPGCVITENILDFGERKIGETHSLSFTISNASTVPEVIDSFYITPYSTIFFADPALPRPLFLQPGDTDITVFFVPIWGQTYTAQLYVADSLTSSDCSPPMVQGTGVADYVHWSVQPPINFGSVKLCDSAVYNGYWIRNRTTTDNLVIDTIMMDSSAWFAIEPDPATLAGSIYPPADSIAFDRIAFHPRGLLTPSSFAMTLVYHVDTLGAPIDTLRIIPVSSAAGCAGRLSVASTIAFDTVDINLYDLDTLYLTNLGDCSLDIDSITIDGAGFSLPSFTAPRAIAPSGTLAITARFDPADLGMHTGTMTIYHDGYAAGFDPDVDCPLVSQNEVRLSGFAIDLSPPAIAMTSVTNCGHIVSLNISDIGSGVASAYALWRAGNASGGFVPMTNDLVHVSGDTWRLIFSDNDMSPDSVALIGYELTVYATDYEGLTDTLTASIPGCIPYEDGAAMIAGPTWLGGTGQDTLWHLVSFPGSLPSYRADSIFELLSGLPSSTAADDDTWRLYDYRNHSFVAVTTDGSNQRVLPGKGYWFRHIHALDTLRLDTGGLASTWPTYSPFSIRLSYGWNLIGSPFLFPVSIDERLLDVTKLSSFVSQARPAASGGGGWWEIADTAGSLPQLMPWRGYAIRCEDPAGYTIYLDPHYHPTSNVAANAQWNGAIFLRSGDVLTGRVDIGVDPSADDGVDIRDIRQIDFFAAKPNLILGDNIDGGFVRDIRRGEALETWKLDYNQSEGASMVISWTSQPLPSDSMALVLRDIVADTVIDMTAAGEYRIKNPGQMPSGRLMVYLGDKSAVAAALNQTMAAVPKTYKLYQNYPNPFNPTTTIAYDLSAASSVSLVIFDVSGRKIRTLEDGYREAGSYQVVWDGRDDDGRRVSSGIYLYRLRADNFTASKKLMLLK